jgi:excinuclease ABC subunit C
VHRRTDRRPGPGPRSIYPERPGTRPPPAASPLTAGVLVRWARRVGSPDIPACPDIPAVRAAAALPLGPGVYRFRDQAGRVLYLGRAVSLRRRVQSYWRDLGDRAHLAPMVARIARVEAVPCDSAHEAAWLERNLLQRRLPPWNRSPGGQEAEVWIRVSTASRAPGLAVVRQQAPGDFGPYLGGQKARDAVSGLSRVLPLGHAADHQSGTGRELALVRGASPAVRAGLARAIAAVLNRDQVAVAALRAELTARRDAAATALAFEFAGKLQAELEAVDWVTAEQKVTRNQRDTGDADVYGWAGGVLVSFEIRGGRMSGWRQRPCPAAAAQRYLGRSAPGWAAFALRSAELAARLGSPQAGPAARLRPSPPGTCAG